MPSRRECAALWLDHLLAKLPRIELTLLIGQYAQRQFPDSRRIPSLTETAMAWREYALQNIPLPHPSPREQQCFKLSYVMADKDPYPGTHEEFVAPLWEHSVGSTIHCCAGDAAATIVGAVITATLGLPMWLDYVVE